MFTYLKKLLTRDKTKKKKEAEETAAQNAFQDQPRTTAEDVLGGTERALDNLTVGANEPVKRKVITLYTASFTLLNYEDLTLFNTFKLFLERKNSLSVKIKHSELLNYKTFDTLKEDMDRIHHITRNRHNDEDMRNIITRRPPKIIVDLELNLDYNQLEISTARMVAGHILEGSIPERDYHHYSSRHYKNLNKHFEQLVASDFKTTLKELVHLLCIAEISKEKFINHLMI